MKKLLSLALFFFSVTAWTQEENTLDSTGLPGDHFSLEIALDLFSKSESIEDFEKKLNEESNHANNLDINGDGEIDYIRVIDQVDGNDHALTLEVPVSETESQDIAVIEIEKNGEESAQLQIVGDEDLYGEEKYVEPTDEKASGGKGGPFVSLETSGIVINVWFWPGVRFIYGPAYRPWISPWRWHHYPGYWKPWRPYGWRAHYGYCRPFHTRYHVVTIHRCTRAHAVYKSKRVTSVTVHNRYKDAHVRHKERTGGQSWVKAKGKSEKVSGEKRRGKSTGPAKKKSDSPKPAKTARTKGGGSKGGGKRK
ncbi:MAG: hypothetical protein ACKVOK_01710 [Flavobacteriales bacterium]